MHVFTSGRVCEVASLCSNRKQKELNLVIIMKLWHHVVLKPASSSEDQRTGQNAEAEQTLNTSDFTCRIRDDRIYMKKQLNGRNKTWGDLSAEPDSRAEQILGQNPPGTFCHFLFNDPDLDTFSGPLNRVMPMFPRKYVSYMFLWVYVPKNISVPCYLWS